MSNQIFHFSNTGISSGQRFYLKDDVSGIFVRNLNIDSNFPVLGSNLVYNTGNQTINGAKTFASRPTVNSSGVLLVGEALNNQSVYTSGDLTGYLITPTINKLQGYPLSINSPSAGQTLIYNGSTWVPGANANGGGGGGGLVYYFDFANRTGIAPTGGLPTTGDHALSLLGRQYAIGSGQAISNELDPRFVDRLLCSFVTASGDPAVSNIPAGLWDFNIWASVNSPSATQCSISAQVNIYNPTNSTYRYLASTDDVYLYETDTIAQYILNATVPQTGIASDERIYIQLFGKKYTTNNRNITIYFDSYRPSHVHTTIPSVAGSGVVKVINGVFQTPASTIVDVDVNASANIQQSKIANLSSDLNTIRNNIASTGSTLVNSISSLSGNSVLLYGSQTIGGIKTFSSNTFYTNDINVAQNIRATGSVYFSDNLYVTGNLTVGGSINNPSLVLTKGKQTISGVKTFADNMSLNAYTGNGYSDTNNDFRLNIGGDTNENAGILIDSYGINPPQILMRRARGIPTGLSGVLKDDVLFNLQARGYVSGLNAYSTNSRAAIRLIAAEDWVGKAGYTGQGTYISFRTTDIGSSLAADKIIIGTSGINVLNGNIYISGNPVLTGVNLSSYATTANLALTGSTLQTNINTLSDQMVYKTGDQNISGTKNFYSRPTVNGTGILLSGEASSVTLPNTLVYITGDQIISGKKTFVNNIVVSGTGNFNSVQVSSIDKLFLSGIDVVITGNSSINLYNAIYISGNAVLTGVTPTSQTITNVVYTTGDQIISGLKTFVNSGVFSLSGITPLFLPSNPLSIIGSGNTYVQLNIQNRATGTDASADLVITANNGTDSSNFINLGINNSGYNNSSFTNGSGFDGYLFIDGGDLDIGTRTPGKVIEFHAGGTTANKTIARITESGINIVSGTYRLNNIPYNIFTTTFLSSNANLVTGHNYISNVGAGYSNTFADRLVPIMETCTARKASISLLNAGAGNNIVGITGLLINTSSIPPQTGIINSSINATTGSNQYTYTGTFITPINISAGDNVACSLFSNNTATNVRTSATIYFYN
jgi:hypothetical protein